MTVAERLAATLSDRYRIERELGAGGMATVYLAEDVRHRRKVALKVLHPELSAVLGPEQFLEEIELTASLQHPWSCRARRYLPAASRMTTTSRRTGASS
jgi:eukaryotic-like serine/threonine-protein kinase